MQNQPVALDLAMLSPNFTKNHFTFWFIFGLSPNLGLIESLSKRLIQNVQWASLSIDTYYKNK